MPPDMRRQAQEACADLEKQYLDFLLQFEPCGSLSIDNAKTYGTMEKFIP